ncbi:MAG: hypothetical protein CMJ59_06275 [Planctomycetaceae bacterium]|nr:hypothetical protein [Planctomycetaceae bacterium]
MCLFILGRTISSDSMTPRLRTSVIREFVRVTDSISDRSVRSIPVHWNFCGALYAGDTFDVVAVDDVLAFGTGGREPVPHPTTPGTSSRSMGDLFGMRIQWPTRILSHIT